MTEEELSSSKLGTLEYWEEAYEREIENFNDNGDEGEVWFGIQSAKRVINWLKNNNLSKDTAIIDIGCGNGYTCCLLAELGYSSVMGVDYSEKAINLANSIKDKKNLNIDFKVVDVLNENAYPDRKFKIAIDKGTYDAIALCPDDPKTKRLLYKKYLCNILKSTDSLFIITSCNWTTKELVEFFTSNNEFELVEEIKSQTSFSFGGASGSTTSTVVFKFLNKNNQ